MSKLFFLDRSHLNCILRGKGCQAKKKGGKVFKTRRSVYAKSQRHQRPKCVRGITCRYLGERGTQRTEEHALNSKSRGLSSFLWTVGEPWRYVSDTLKLAYLEEFTW